MTPTNEVVIVANDQDTLIEQSVNYNFDLESNTAGVDR